MKNLRLLIILLFLSNISFAQITDTVGNTIVRIDSLMGFAPPGGSFYENNPWDLHWGPDNTLWFTVDSKVCRYDTAAHTVDTIFKRQSSLGSYAMSVATHPDFFNNPVVYVTYDTTSWYYAGGNRIVLFKYDYSFSGDSLYNETQILSWNHGGEHSGGRLHVGNDGYLYVTTAEYWPYYDTAVTYLSGKILRVNLNGTIPASNISGGYGISYGHRNPQGIVQAPNGNIIISELGAITDELNHIYGYNNYGWPVYDANYCVNIIPDSCASPTFSYEPPIDTALLPPSGIDYYHHPAIPEFQGCVLQSILSFGGIKGGIVASKLNASMDDVISSVHYFKGEYARFRDVCVSPDGKVFAITNDRYIPRIRVIYNPLFVSTGEEPELNHIQLFPNPSETSVTLQGKRAIGNWVIYTVDGKPVQTGKTFSNTVTIDVTRLENGIYCITSSAGTTRLLVQH